MHVERFRDWMENVRGLSTRTVSSRISNCRRVEDYEGDLDGHYHADGLVGLIDSLNPRRPEHGIPIDGNVYDGTATLKSAVSLYRAFRNEGGGTTDLIGAPAKRQPQMQLEVLQQSDRPADTGAELSVRGEAYYERDALAAALPEILPLAERDDVDAQFQLGLMYAYGEGVPADDVKAAKWFRMAAERGHADAQTILGVVYALGKGVPEDDAEAMKWLRMAAEQGHGGAQNNLGDMYAFGRGVREDDAEAMKWYRMAAEQGIIEAQYNLGRLMYVEDAWFTDDVEAHAWLNLAAAQGHKEAEERKEHIAKSMTPRRRRRAQKRAREYWEAYVVPFRD